MKTFLTCALLLVSATALGDDILAAGQPDQARIAEYAEQGYTTIIDLRGEKEERGMDEPAVADEAGIRYVSLPVPSRKAVNFDTARKLDEILETADGPVVVHCASGNRVGALLALRASLNGASDEEALALGKANRMTRLAGHVEKLLGEEDSAP